MTINSSSNENSSKYNISNKWYKYIIVIILFRILLIGIHTVSEGHRGIIYIGNALQNYIEKPGFHFSYPIISRKEEIDIRQQTDRVVNVPCGTSGGILLKFGCIEVVNQLDEDSVLDIIGRFGENYDKPLIFDKVHHEINQWCSNHSLQEVYVELFSEIDEYLANSLQNYINKFTTGLNIISVRVTKPQVPQEITSSFQNMEKAKAEYAVAVQEQKVTMKRAETEKMKSIEDANRKEQVSSIDNRIRLNKEKIEAEIKKVKIDTQYYKITKEAESNKQLLTSSYLEMKRFESIWNNTKIYFGNEIPSIYPFSINNCMI